jgi:hypothetical protein
LFVRSVDYDDDGINTRKIKQPRVAEQFPKEAKKNVLVQNVNGKEGEAGHLFCCTKKSQQQLKLLIL